MSKRRRSRPVPATPRSMRQPVPARASAATGRPSNTLLLGGLITVVAVIVVGFALFSSSGGQGGYTCESLLAQSSAGPDGVASPDQGRAHLPAGRTLDYAHCPPASGPHFSQSGYGPIPARFYGPAAETSPGGWLHNLEHGYVAILYSCGTDGTTCPTADELVALERFQGNAPSTAGAQACGIPSKVLTVRFDSMSTRFAFLAWNRVALSDTFDPVAAAAFASRWIDQSPGIEPGLC